MWQQLQRARVRTALDGRTVNSFCRRGTYADGHSEAVGIGHICRRLFYADGRPWFAEAIYADGPMPTGTVGIAFADGFRSFADGFSRQHST